ncbi:methylamine utilization protein MauE [Mucilaginibacter gracilis]|uniref:Methylamine utilization protein MauE n=1 Tax=Mucilaginibacter gracilis TaxID=423350 RepID=A0A495IUX1_9SPHI|nr:MauE/DoxX family redox-associated membrane protein [Mucilaginibacter gracilis]RKR80557.1 methylamine utilization protein MauE [Mucilaginibacter gracilis]
MKKDIIIVCITALLVALFLYASFSKYFDYAYFQRSMYNQIFPHWMATCLIYTIPPVEIIIAIGLMQERTRLIALYAFFILMALFSIYIAAGLLHVFSKVPCSCGGIIKSFDYGEHLIFNIFFVALSGTAIWLKKSKHWKRKTVNHLHFNNM